MVENKKPEKRPRGRPPVRCDDETRSLIIEAANPHFQENGFASANINLIAQAASVSTKTLYRLFPTKADLFSSVVSDRIGQFFLTLDETALARMEPRDGLVRLLTAYGNLALAEYTIAIYKLVVAEADRFPEIANTFHTQAIARTNEALERWLVLQANLKRLKIEDATMASGMLRGMMIMEPQRAVLLRQRQPPTPEEIATRAEICADLFLNGSRHRGDSASS
ncbi:TetR/AcrR family transcriptional regulator [Pararhizobium sp. BT-229]|uniref:TetR/AcrR family transcriptional regulator n=1 Tax=Pararhizobium sp. BT-229 TaxID=2986923 RepID=UPI0021F6A3BE|nr:TetR/AcrR family transcriptional regulator [Pararhizobium sp. BT-229]MCV9962698.1 TetR/AcrR family transcriptional regulator [Pararhizobium sp. BT-229]